MSFPKTTAQFRPVGMISDVSPSELPPDVWSEAVNVNFRSGQSATRIMGSRLAYDPVQALPLNAINHLVGSQNFWVYTGDQIQRVVTSDTDNDITISGLSSQPSPHLHSLFSFNGVVVHNNFIDAPMFWANDPLSPFTELPGWNAGDRARLIVPHLFHLFAIDLTTSDGPRHLQVKWSDSAEPGTVPATWVPDPTNDAGFVDLADTPGPVIAAKGLARTLMLYKRSSIYAADFVEDNRVYIFRVAFKGVGALTPRSVVDIGRRHAILADNDVFVTDGSDIQSIISSQVKTRLFSQLDQDNFLNSFLLYHRTANELWVCIPTAGNTFANKAFVYHLGNRAWSERDIPISSAGTIGIVTDITPSGSWDDSVGTWDQAVGSWDTADLSQLESVVLASPEGSGSLNLMDSETAVAIEARVSKAGITFGQPERLKSIRRLHVYMVKGSQDVEVRIGSQMSPLDSITWTPFMVLSTNNQVIDLFIVGRYISVEIRGSDENIWGVDGFDLEVELRGYH